MGLIQILLLIILGIISFYIVFVAAPAFTIFYAVYHRGKSITLLDVKSIENTYYGPFVEELFSANDYLMSLKPEHISIKASDGINLTADYFKGGNKRIALLFPGFHGNLSNNFMIQAKYIYDLGFDVICVTERAHDDCGGKWTGLGLKERYDLLDWVNYSKELGYEKCLLWGTSMGGAIVSYASDQVDPEYVKAMIIDCGFNSPREQTIKDCKMRHIPWYLMIHHMEFFVKIFARVGFRERTTEHLSRTTIPAFFIHGELDESVPISNSYENYESCNSYKECFWCKDAKHIVSFLVGGEEIRKSVTAFINKFL